MAEENSSDIGWLRSTTGEPRGEGNADVSCPRLMVLAFLARIDVSERMAAKALRTHDFIVDRKFVAQTIPFNGFQMNVDIQVVRHGIDDKFDLFVVV